MRPGHGGASLSGGLGVVGRSLFEVGSAYDERAVSSRLLVEVSQHILDYAKFEAEHNGVRDVSILLVDGDPADQILRCIEEQDIDCVVMGSHGLSGIKGILSRQRVPQGHEPDALYLHRCKVARSQR